MTIPSGSRPRVLVVAYDFPPHAAIGTMRTLRVVRQLHARGWDITVLTSDPSRYLPSTPIDAALLAQVPADVRIIRAGAVRPWEWMQQALLAPLRGRAPGGGQPAAQAPGARSNAPAVPGRRNSVVAALAKAKDVVDAALSIPDRESGWLMPALAKGVVDGLRDARPDVIYSSAPPWTGQIVAAGLRLALRRPWVADFRDPWSRAPWRGDRYRFALRAAAALERFVIRRADRIIFVAAANRDDFAATYGPSLAAKFDVVPNGCDPTEFDALRHLRPDGGPFVMLHAGSLYAGRTPVPLLKAIAAAIERGLIDRRQFRLRFLGANGLQGVDLPGTCRALGLDEVVEFLPRVPREQSLRAMMSASCLLLLQPGHTVSVPGKVYEYLATGRPIFAIAEEGETAWLVRESSNSVSLTPEGEDAMVEALAAMVRQRSMSSDPPARTLFDGNVRAAQIAGILESIVGGPHSPASLAGAEVES